MKPFNINRNSWHYRMNTEIFNADNSARWERTHSNFCAYWRTTVFRLLFISLLLVLAFSVVAVLVVNTIKDPITTAIGFGIIVLAVGFIIGLVVLSEYFDDIAEQDKEPKTIIGKRYVAWKTKVCPSVEFK